MGIANRQLEELRSQIQAGFLIDTHQLQNSVHYFHFPALEHTYTLRVPDSPDLQAFMASPAYQDALMVPVTVGAALLDIVGFSSQPNDVQFKMIVRYQSLIRAALKGKNVRKLISIGDGTIFVFDEASISTMPKTLFELDHELAGFNLDFGNDGVPEINRRIGVHISLAYRIKDINGDENYIGTAMNLAQRVSTCVPTGEDEENTPFDLRSTIYVSAEACQAFQQNGLPPDFVLNDAGDKPIKDGQTFHVFAMQKATGAV